MSRYTVEEQETINKVKEYLNSLRKINQEKFSLELEYNDIPLPQSIKYSDEAPGGYSKPKDVQMTSRMMKRDLIIKKLKLFNQEVDKFVYKTYLLSAAYRNIANVYINSKSYSDMIQTLESDIYCISESTYKRHFPKMCLKLVNYIDINNIPTVDKLNDEFNKMIR